MEKSQTKNQGGKPSELDYKKSQKPYFTYDNVEFICKVSEYCALVLFGTGRLCWLMSNSQRRNKTSGAKGCRRKKHKGPEKICFYDLPRHLEIRTATFHRNKLHILCFNKTHCTSAPRWSNLVFLKQPAMDGVYKTRVNPIEIKIPFQTNASPGFVTDKQGNNLALHDFTVYEKEEKRVSDMTHTLGSITESCTVSLMSTHEIYPPYRIDRSSQYGERNWPQVFKRRVANLGSEFLILEAHSIHGGVFRSFEIKIPHAPETYGDVIFEHALGRAFIQVTLRGYIFITRITYHGGAPKPPRLVTSLDKIDGDDIIVLRVVFIYGCLLVLCKENNRRLKDLSVNMLYRVRI